MSIAILAVVALLASSCITEEQGIVLNLANGDRIRSGARTVSIHGDAQKRAQEWAEHMAKTGKLDHDPGLQRFVDNHRSICRGAENVGTSRSGNHVADLFYIQERFMNSPGHRANVQNRIWTHAGIGHAVDSRGQTWVAQVFVQVC